MLVSPLHVLWYENQEGRAILDFEVEFYQN